MSFDSMSLTKLFWFDTGSAFFGVVTTPKGGILEAAPIVRWSVGKSIKDLVAHLKKHGLLRMGTDKVTLTRQADGGWVKE